MASPIPILCAALLALPMLAVRGDHLLSQVLFCQPFEPSSGLLEIFDEDQMFHYNFSGRSTSAWSRDFDQWSGGAFPGNISSDLSFCNLFRKNLTEALDEVMPEARGGTYVTVFTALPLRMGQPNTLVCSIGDVYPPALTITWRKGGKVLSQGLNSYGYVAREDLSFLAFSYLNVTPAYGDTYSCEVQVAGDNRTIVSYWVPTFPIPSDLLENILCGLGFALGLVFLLLGFVFLFLSKSVRDSD